MTQSQVDALLALAISQAKQIGIPVAGNISPRVELNYRAKNRFGCCIHRPTGPVIELNAQLATEGSRDAILTVLVHEVLHTCPGCNNHGDRWQYYAMRMRITYGYEIQTRDSFGRLGIEDKRTARYRVICNRCGAQFTRQKRSPLVDHPERYRCKCGGKLRVEEVLDD